MKLGSVEDVDSYAMEAIDVSVYAVLGLPGVSRRCLSVLTIIQASRHTLTGVLVHNNRVV